MDIQQLVSELGVPIALSVAMMWGCFYLIKYITGQHTILMNQRFQALTDITIKLIDQSKVVQSDVSNLDTNVKTLVSFIIESKDREQERLLSQMKKQNGFK